MASHQLKGADWIERDWHGAYVGYTCKARGCALGNMRGSGGNKRGAGAGYCARHYRQFLRTGSPLTRKEVSSAALVDAALAYADAPGAETVGGLMWAAVEMECAMLRLSAPGPVEMDLAPGANRLAQAAREYAEVDPGRDHDEEFTLASGVLFIEARRYAKQFMPSRKGVKE